VVSDPDQPNPISELAREAVRALAEGRSASVDDAIRRAYDVTGIDTRTRRPTRAELRAHAQAFEESEHGEVGRLLRIDATFEEAGEVLAALEATVLARESDGMSLPAPEVYGRAARGLFDLDPVVHARVTTSLSAAVLAQALFEAGFDDPTCGSIDTRYGRIDEIAFDGEFARYRILRIPPRMGVDPGRDVVRGNRVDHADFTTLAALRSRQCRGLPPHGER